MPLSLLPQHASRRLIRAFLCLACLQCKSCSKVFCLPVRLHAPFKRNARASRLNLTSENNTSRHRRMSTRACQGRHGLPERKEPKRVFFPKTQEREHTGERQRPERKPKEGKGRGRQVGLCLSVPKEGKAKVRKLSIPELPFCHPSVLLALGFSSLSLCRSRPFLPLSFFFPSLRLLLCPLPFLVLQQKRVKTDGLSSGGPVCQVDVRSVEASKWTTSGL